MTPGPFVPTSGPPIEAAPSETLSTKLLGDLDCARRQHAGAAHCARIGRLRSTSLSTPGFPLLPVHGGTILVGGDGRQGLGLVLGAVLGHLDGSID